MEYTYRKFVDDIADGVYLKMLDRYTELGYPKAMAELNASLTTNTTMLNSKMWIQDDWDQFYQDCENIYHGYSNLAYPKQVSDTIETVFDLGEFFIIRHDMPHIKAELKELEEKNNG